MLYTINPKTEVILSIVGAFIIMGAYFWQLSRRYKKSPVNFTSPFGNDVKCVLNSLQNSTRYAELLSHYTLINDLKSKYTNKINSHLLERQVTYLYRYYYSRREQLRPTTSLNHTNNTKENR